MKHLLRLFLPVILILLTMGCSLGLTAQPSPTSHPTNTKTPTITPELLSMEPVSPVIGMPDGTDGYPWWNDSVFYEIFVRSFYDSDGDGIGDFNGIREKLDYLNDGDSSTTDDLGVTGLWLMPIFPSPSYHGYDVTDYYAVNPQYGTLDDFKALLAAAHGRGIRIIIDMVFNHTSSQHPWFVEARDPTSPYHDWYIWSDLNPGYKGSWGQQVWFPLAGRYFYSTFTAGMPDLNYTNQEVTAEMKSVSRFWLEEVGVDGFRLDAAKHLIEEGTIQANSDSTHAWWESFRPFFKEVAPQAMIVGELWDTTEITAEYLEGDELDLAFEFYLANDLVLAVQQENAEIASERLTQVDEILPEMQYAPFLTNHDQVRVMTQVLDNMDKARVAASLLLTALGVPFLYYGEEVGMQGEKPDEWIRRPMQWSDGTYGGFSSASPWEPLGPGWKSFNVEEESSDPGSLLSHYRDLIRARNQHAALRVGDVNVVTTYNDALYSLLRVSGEEAVLVLVNLSGETITDYALKVEASSLAEGSYTPLPILGEGEFETLMVTSGGRFALYMPVAGIPPYATLILQLHYNTP